MFWYIGLLSKANTRVCEFFHSVLKTSLPCRHHILEINQVSDGLKQLENLSRSFNKDKSFEITKMAQSKAFIKGRQERQEAKKVFKYSFKINL